ncbi:MAG: ATP-binding protein [Desulfuromonadaceae bacterium]|nr:ATP-binding protein [Desulfuromonadaceae bacterium]
MILPLPELTDILTRICSGDTAARFQEIAEHDHFRTVKKLVNDLGAYIEDTNSVAQEMAMGLCEHYEILNRISQGDFSARAAVNSGSEIVAKMGELINLEADSLTAAISRAKQAEDETKSAYQQLVDIVEFLPDATLVVDRSNKIIAWNRAIEKMSGIGKDEMLGKPSHKCSLAFYGEERPMLIDLLGQEPDLMRQHFTHFNMDGNTLFAEIFIPSFRNGGNRTFWATATPLFDKEVNPSGGIESIRDITAYKRSEEERIRLESGLQQAKIIEAFMMRLGHDLRTPLTPLTALLPLIKERVTNNPELERMLDICRRSTTNITKLIDRAQALANLSIPIARDSLAHTSLSLTADIAYSENADVMAVKHVTWQNDIRPDVIVPAVSEQLTVLFANLITNSVDASPPHTTIRVTAEQQDGTVTVAVRDEGVGLRTEHLDCIFDAFFKVDESRHDLDAVGLGLAICKRIVLNHHGRIWAESQGLGKGAAIIFTINQEAY